MLKLAPLALAVAVPLLALAADSPTQETATQDDLQLTLRQRVATAPDSGRYHTVERDEAWDPDRTALIVCDVWDLHHCLNAVRRVEEFAPRLNEVIHECRDRGVTIIHAPSDCMDYYAEHPARLRAVNTPTAENLPAGIGSWCSIIPAEERAVYPIDQSDGGEDDDPAEHAEWEAQLAEMGRDPGLPWQSQSELIDIDAERDYISDRGAEVWSILEAHRIENVILTGVHTNMCVLGRPFGLRQMAKNGKHVVLMRDMTDTMYNPERWPYVSHFTGTDLIVEHIEKYVCPTITSDQIIGGEAFVFSGDNRPHLAIVIAEDEYATEQTLPEFARHLGRDFRVSLVYGSETERNHIPGLDVLDEADLLLVSIRRRTLPPAQLDRFREFVAAGKPVLGIRTASHAFSLRNAEPEEGLDHWPKWDAEVFGGNYTNHYGNALTATIQPVEEQLDHPILTGVPNEEFVSGGSLYRTSPLKEGATVLMTGKVEGHPAEPVAWTFTRADGGTSFYTSLGHREDFEHPAFQRLLLNAIYWTAGLDVPDEVRLATTIEDYRRRWMPMPVPGTWAEGSDGVLASETGPAWYRCVIRIPEEWEGAEYRLRLKPTDPTNMQGYVNGEQIGVFGPASGSFVNPWLALDIPAGLFQAEEANLLVLRIEEFMPWGRRADGTEIAPRPGIAEPPRLHVNMPEGPAVESLDLSGTWQFRIGDDPSFATLPLPAKFAASTDVIFAPDAIAAE